MKNISKKCYELLRKKGLINFLEPKSNLVTKLLGLFKKFFSNYFIL